MANILLNSLYPVYYNNENNISNFVYSEKYDLYFNKDLSDIMNNLRNISYNIDKTVINYNLVTNMSNSYAYCYNLTGSPKCSNNVINMSHVYRGCRNLTGYVAYSPNATNMCCAYEWCINLQGSPVCGPYVTNMRETYGSCYNIIGNPVCGSNVIDMSSAYASCNNLNGFPACGDNVNNLSWTYMHCSNLIGNPVCGNNVNDMYMSYGYCSNISGNPVCGYKVDNMGFTYQECPNLYGDMYCYNAASGEVDMSMCFYNRNISNSLNIHCVKGSKFENSLINNAKGYGNIYGIYPSGITWATMDNGYGYYNSTYNTCIYNNLPAIVKSIEITNPPDKTSYNSGEYFDPTGMIVMATLQDGAIVEIKGYDWSPNRPLMRSDSEIIISYGGQTATQLINVIAPYLCFEATQSNSKISLLKIGSPNWSGSYSIDLKNWTEYIPGSTGNIILNNIGDKVYFKGEYTSDNSINDYLQFSMSGKISASGDIMSFCSGDDFESVTAIPYSCMFCYLFKDCGSLISTPILPAITLSKNCYYYMFDGCTALTIAPALPAVTLSEGCYWGMFSMCRSLINASVLPSTELSTDCYCCMFLGCTSLTTMPELPATTLAYRCYQHMFMNCTSLINVSDLPAYNISGYAYDWMFWGCTSLVNCPKIYASNLNQSYCCNGMFGRCTSITSTPSLSATKLGYGCYSSMFEGCTSLINPPELPSTSLYPTCYKEMFKGCISLNNIPALPATKLASSCYEEMFSGCTSLYISDEGEDPIAIPSSGTFANTYSQTGMFAGCAGTRSSDDMPGEEGEYYTYYTKESFKGLCFTANTAGSTITLNKIGSPSWTGYYSTDGNIWIDYAPGITGTITLANIRDKVYFKGTYTAATSNSNYLQFTMTGSIAASGNIMSFCSGDNFESVTTIPYSYMFYCLFNWCESLTTPPVLPATTLTGLCYDGMFAKCTSLTTAPALPATTLDHGCYMNMFAYCTALTTAPALPATTLDGNCYNSMFEGCTALITAPALPATTLELAEYCYESMFSGCTALTTAPALPATTLAYKCYDSMFKGCTSLILAPELPAITLDMDCYYYMFSGCTSLTTAPVLPATTLASSCYFSMFNDCTSLTTAPALPATTLAIYCYSSMFEGCSSLTTTPTLPATILADYCYSYMFLDCTSLTTASELPATILNEACYINMFSNCTSLTTAPTLPATTLAGWCYCGMFAGCSSLTTAPELPAIALAYKCYAYMFKDCSLLYVSDTSETGCDKVWRIPSSETFTDSCSQAGMFTGCAGTRSSDDMPGEEGEYYIYYTKENFKGLCFTANTAGSTFYLDRYYPSYGTENGSFWDPDFEYSTDKSTWNKFNVGSSGIITLANAGDKVYLRGNNTEVSVSDDNYRYFVMTGSISASGSIMSLLDGNGLSKTISVAYCFFWLFKNCSSLTSAPELTATTLSVGCYKQMFSGCTSLTTAPALPATTLANYCYAYMFRNCTSLNVQDTVNKLTAHIDFTSTTSPQGLQGIFAGLAITDSMLDEILPNYSLPATTLNTGCYESMFDGCAALTTAPALPATTLAIYCYFYMFDDCSSLTTAPALPATTLADNCYGCMFAGCTSLYVSDTSGTGYDKAWTIPTSGTFTDTFSQTSMFSSCLGTRSSDVMAGEQGQSYTYYTQNEPI